MKKHKRVTHWHKGQSGVSVHVDSPLWATGRCSSGSGTPQGHCPLRCLRGRSGSQEDGEGTWASLAKGLAGICPSNTALCVCQRPACQLSLCSWGSHQNFHPEQGGFWNTTPGAQLLSLLSHPTWRAATADERWSSTRSASQLSPEKWQFEWPIIIELVSNEMLVLYTTTQRTYAVASD